MEMEMKNSDKVATIETPPSTSAAALEEAKPASQDDADSKTGGVRISKFVIFLALVLGVGIVVGLGVVSFMILRPDNCIKVVGTTRPPTNKPAPSTIRPLTLPQETTTPTTAPRTTQSTRQTGPTRTLPTMATLVPPRTTTTIPDPNNIRLPKNFVPINYALTFKIYFKPSQPAIAARELSTERYYIGEETMHFRLTAPTNRLVFHVNNVSLELDENAFVLTQVSTGSQTVIRDEQRGYRPNQFYEILMANDLPIGEYKLKLTFKADFGPLTNLVGSYLTQYTEDKMIKSIVSTKFEPTDARKAFPCFDEPALKATFDVMIEHPAGSFALSNWPTKAEPVSFDEGVVTRYRTTFQTTEKMSTYLLAWVVAPNDFAYRSTKSASGKDIRIFARKAAVDSGRIDFALEVSKKSLDFFEQVYFNSSDAVPPKIDMIGLPDFASGAMEHWGLISYRETAMLYKDNENSVSSKQSVAFTIAHEISHFWFGNLVTCAWWSDLWLQEAMARFLQFKAIGTLYPDWDVDDQFTSMYLVPVMYTDGFATSHPVTTEVITPAQINNAFDSITYDKGSAVLRMLEGVVGADNFRDGLRTYIETYKFGPAVAADLYKSLKMPDFMGGKTAEQYMATWLEQKNYPKVQITVDNVDRKTTVSFRQSRYLLAHIFEDDKPSVFGYRWMIVLKCMAGGVYNPNGQMNQHLEGEVREFDFFLEKQQDSIQLDRSYSWVKCNKNFKGYYVGDYAEDTFKAFEYVMERGNSFAIGDRAHLLHSSFALAFHGDKSYSVPAQLTVYMESVEKDYVPWSVFTWHMNKISTILQNRPTFRDLKNFGTSIVHKLIKSTELWQNTGSHTQQLLKTTLIDYLCRIQEAACLRDATSQYETIDSNYFYEPTNPNYQNNVSPNVRSLVYKYHLQNTYNYKDFFAIRELYEETIDPFERSGATNALSNTRLLWQLDTLQKALLDPFSNIRPQDFFSFLTAMSTNPNGRRSAWYFIRHNWDEIVKKFGLANRTFANSLKTITDSFETEFLYKEMIEFFGRTDPGAGIEQRQRAMDQVLNNIFWVKVRENDIKQNLFTMFDMKNIVA